MNSSSLLLLFLMFLEGRRVHGKGSFCCLLSSCDLKQLNFSLILIAVTKISLSFFRRASSLFFSYERLNDSFLYSPFVSSRRPKIQIYLTSSSSSLLSSSSSTLCYAVGEKKGSMGILPMLRLPLLRHDLPLRFPLLRHVLAPHFVWHRCSSFSHSLFLLHFPAFRIFLTSAMYARTSVRFLLHSRPSNFFFSSHIFSPSAVSKE